jgi:hypothetical protein
MLSFIGRYGAAGYVVLPSKKYFEAHFNNAPEAYHGICDKSILY